MPFVYSNQPHVRKHGPAGYSDYTTFKPWLRDEFRFRCVYCLERERWCLSGHADFGVDHVRPQGNPEFANLAYDYENLVYACNRCNRAKRERLLLDPCVNQFAEHLQIADDGSIVGLTLEGQRLINCLGLADAKLQSTRRRLLLILRFHETHPDDPDARALYVDCFGYPDDLPDLDPLRPEKNSRPTGLTETYFRQREEGRLPETYF